MDDIYREEYFPIPEFTQNPLSSPTRPIFSKKLSPIVEEVSSIGLSHNVLSSNRSSSISRRLERLRLSEGYTPKEFPGIRSLTKA